ncbi:collagen alpha-1(I) chain-like [Cinclus cinclus]|uniref:collagen alpha-1(I) chain-like n=1 Tax=Cinclus cinclus TaxID=127875 RepID=UPI002E0E63C9
MPHEPAVPVAAEPAVPSTDGGGRAFRSAPPLLREREFFPETGRKGHSRGHRFRCAGSPRLRSQRGGEVTRGQRGGPTHDLVHLPHYLSANWCRNVAALRGCQSVPGRLPAVPPPAPDSGSASRPAARSRKTSPSPRGGHGRTRHARIAGIRCSLRDAGDPTPPVLASGQGPDPPPAPSVGGSSTGRIGQPFSPVPRSEAVSVSVGSAAARGCPESGMRSSVVRAGELEADEQRASAAATFTRGKPTVGVAPASGYARPAVSESPAGSAWGWGYETLPFPRLGKPPGGRSSNGGHEWGFGTPRGAPMTGPPRLRTGRGVRVSALRGQIPPPTAPAEMKPRSREEAEDSHSAAPVYSHTALEAPRPREPSRHASPAWRGRTGGKCFVEDRAGGTGRTAGRGCEAAGRKRIVSPRAGRALSAPIPVTVGLPQPRASRCLPGGSAVGVLGARWNRGFEAVPPVHQRRNSFILPPEPTRNPRRAGAVPWLMCGGGRDKARCKRERSGESSAERPPPRGSRPKPPRVGEPGPGLRPLVGVSARKEKWDSAAPTVRDEAAAGGTGPGQCPETSAPGAGGTAGIPPARPRDREHELSRGTGSLARSQGQRQELPGRPTGSRRAGAAHPCASRHPHRSGARFWDPGTRNPQGDSSGPARACAAAANPLFRPSDPGPSSRLRGLRSSSPHSCDELFGARGAAGDRSARLPPRFSLCEGYHGSEFCNETEGVKPLSGSRVAVAARARVSECG